MGRNETGRRIDAIVSNKFRGSYEKLRLLVAMAETLENRGSNQEGRRLIEKYHAQYSRYSAIRRE